jgi:hypothetical protein
VPSCGPNIELDLAVLLLLLDSRVGNLLERLQTKLQERRLDPRHFGSRFLA